MSRKTIRLKRELAAARAALVAAPDVAIAPLRELEGDSSDYEVLTAAARRTTVPGLVCEVGCRLGGGVKAIVEGLQPGRTFITIDPYGTLPYEQMEGIEIALSGYSNSMLAEVMCSAPPYCYERGIRWIPFIMTDVEFMRRFWDGVPIYGEYGDNRTGARIESEYAFVHIDGPHTLEAVFQEATFFSDRMPVGACLCFDDTRNYDHATVDKFLLARGWEAEEGSENRGVYRRVT